MQVGRWSWGIGVALVVAPACGGDEHGAVGDGSPPDATITPDSAAVDSSEPADSAVDTAAPDTQVADTPVVDTARDDSKADSAVDTAVVDTGEPIDTADTRETIVEPPKEVRFVVLGDTGEGNDEQKKVAAAIAQKCQADGCDFAILLGDNIYNAGVESTLDAQWESKFEGPYRDLDMPFYAVLGNHDNGGFLTQLLGDTFGGAGAEFERGDIQVAYTQLSEKWRMPARTYDFAFGPAHFFALDTNDMVWSYANGGAEARTQIQVDSIPDEIDGAPETWRIAFGHHPLFSNGTHGNAGAYEGLEEGITDLVANIPGLGDLQAVVTGDGVQESLDVIVCGRVDLYFAGHDHSRQWLGPMADCPGTTFVVSGAGSKLTEIKGSHPALFQSADKEGFFWVHLKDRQIEVAAIDLDGTVEWTWSGSK